MELALAQARPGTIVTLLELPYEKTVYERPVYPGTLTYSGTVPNIELVRPVSEPRSAKGRGRYRADHMRSLHEFVLHDLVRRCFTERGAAENGKCL